MIVYISIFRLNKLIYYLGHLKEAITNIKRRGKQLAFFMVEPIMGCGGQIIIPPDFMRKSFEIVKHEGGLCIVDEVQIGFGRVGSHFWGFEISNLISGPVLVSIVVSLASHPSISPKNKCRKFFLLIPPSLL